MKLGYVRVSAKDQNEGRQLLKMRELGIEERFIFIDKQSGKDFERPQYQAMKQVIREGDIIYMDALDRLGRNYDGIINEWKYITRELNADIVILENETLFDSRKFKAMDTVDVNGERVGMGKLLEDQFLSMLSYVAEQERMKIKQRQAEGIALAKAEGRAYGRHKVAIDDNFIAAYDQWKNREITAVKAMELAGMKKVTFYARVKEYEGQA
ncbi:recombinase family protein [Pelosinus propionicus]|uniref:Site-specific DNA recombinase n=1 Tax=Pelosinus propionicus DSM 13327 TaxID=1123291 RepID=A0A1I4PAR4_9FIRM|nr:recombinase family protein [Pelosinus propionicus]SFM24735.1 Site-specific DNA recombinase [Pelosinus propionicus DSM 13327]